MMFSPAPLVISDPNPPPHYDDLLPPGYSPFPDPDMNPQ